MGGCGDLGLEGRCPPDPVAYGVGLVQGVGGGVGDRTGDEGAECGEDVQGAGVPDGGAGVSGKRATATGQAAGTRAPDRSAITVTSSGHISAGLTRTVSRGRCTVSRQVSSLMMCSPSSTAASQASRTSSGGATVAVGSSTTDSSSSFGRPPSARTRRTVSSRAYGSGMPPHSAGVGTW